MPLPPIVQPVYSSDQYRYIGGFLLFFRAALFQMMESTQDAAADPIPRWKNQEARYLKDAEAFSRWLLSFTGYPVEKWQLWQGDLTYFDPRLGG